MPNLNADIPLTERDAASPVTEQLMEKVSTNTHVAIYNSAGTYAFVAPTGVTTVYGELTGAGGGGSYGLGGTTYGQGGRRGKSYAFEATVVPGTSYTIVVGAGGLPVSTTPGVAGTAGGNSTAFGLTAAGGAGGAASTSSTDPAVYSGEDLQPIGLGGTVVTTVSTAPKGNGAGSAGRYYTGSAGGNADPGADGRVKIWW